MNAKKRVEPDELDAGWSTPDNDIHDRPTVPRIVLPELIPENEQTPTEQHPISERWLARLFNLGDSQ